MVIEQPFRRPPAGRKTGWFEGRKKQTGGAGVVSPKRAAPDPLPVTFEGVCNQPSPSKTPADPD